MEKLFSLELVQFLIFTFRQQFTTSTGYSYINKGTRGINFVIVYSLEGDLIKKYKESHIL